MKKTNIEQVDAFIFGIENNVLISDKLKEILIDELVAYKICCDKLQKKYKTWSNFPKKDTSTLLDHGFVDTYLKMFNIFSEEWLQNYRNMYYLIVNGIPNS